MIKKLFAILLHPVLLTCLGLLILGLLIWWIGPLIAIGSIYPLTSEFARWVTIGGFVLLAVLRFALSRWQQRRAARRLADGMVQVLGKGSKTRLLPVGKKAREAIGTRLTILPPEEEEAMLREAGCTWVLTGHSERRHVLGESPDFVGKKTAFALEQGFSVILCIGETLAERKAGKLNSILWLQLERGLAGLGPNADYSRLAVAYEPVWAIGTGQTASDEDIRMVHTLVRELLSSLLGSNGIGIQLRVPVFDGFEKRSKIRRAKVEEENARIGYEDALKGMQANYMNAVSEVNNSQRNYKKQFDNYTMAQDVYNVTADQYKEGVASMTAVLQDEMRMSEAMNNYLTAYYRYKVANLSLLKLTGQLNQISVAK